MLAPSLMPAAWNGIARSRAGPRARSAYPKALAVGANSSCPAMLLGSGATGFHEPSAVPSIMPTP